MSKNSKLCQFNWATLFGKKTQLIGFVENGKIFVKNVACF